MLLFYIISVIPLKRFSFESSKNIHTKFMYFHGLFVALKYVWVNKWNIFLQVNGQIMLWFNGHL